MENARCGEIAVLLDQLEDLIEEGKTNFLSGKVEERNKILNEAQKEAHIIIEEAREQMQNMIEKDQITLFAKERAESIITTAKEDAKEMHRGAIAYAQETCKDVEQRLKFTLESIHQEVQNFESYITDMLREVYDNRQELKEMSNQIEKRNEE